MYLQRYILHISLHNTQLAGMTNLKMYK